MRLQTLRGSYLKDQIKWGSNVHPWATAGWRALRCTCHSCAAHCGLRAVISTNLTRPMRKPWAISGMTYIRGDGAEGNTCHTKQSVVVH